MDDEAKYGRETMNKVLGWGTIVYFLVLGFSGSQHALFELYPLPEQIELDKAKRTFAVETEAKSKNAKDPSEASELRLKAAQASFDARLFSDERQDARRRAISLIVGASIYCLAYPFAIHFFYRANVTRHKATYFISHRMAVLYGTVMSAITLSLALMTAIL